MTTIIDVAKKAGVSQGTVSCVLNTRTSAIAISEKTRQRVLQAAADLGYYRDEIASAMITGQLSMIGVAVPEVHSEVVGGILEGILDVAEEFNYFIKVIRIGKRSGDEIAHLCLQYRLAGIVCSQLPDALVEDIHRGLQPDHVPMVVVDNSAPAPWKIRVLSNDEGGIHQAVEHLKTLGHRHIGCCTYTSRTAWGGRRLQAFVSAMEALDLDVKPKWIFQDLKIENNFSPVMDHFKDAVSRPASLGSYAGTSPALTRPRRASGSCPASPSALICCDGDYLAMALIRALRGIGLKVPEDISIIGFADYFVSSLADPPLTTVRQHFWKMGSAAMRRLMAWILDPAKASKNTTLTEVIPTTLVVRSSTAAPRESSPHNKRKE
ncbi:MAG: LacI family transcriptional regulator [Verrucomicrobia bacterium]|nr:LacI family transcriptional regulator [Verrucomicrobiota bacterium]